MSDEELEVATAVGGGALGAGESAVIAIAETRHWAAGIDETLGSQLFESRTGRKARAVRDALRWAVANGLIKSDEAQVINHEMRTKGYKGPEFFWIES